MAQADFAPAQFHVFTDRDMAARACAVYIAKALRRAHAARSHASLLVSGGSSPKPVYQALSQQDLPWDKTRIALVDDRWVNTDEAGSNARFIGDNLLQGAAKSAQFTGMKNAAATPFDGLKEAEQAYAQIARPYDIAVMGMGTDGHTASWFPGAGNLREVMDITTDKALTAIDATGCPVSGDHPLRMTLTVPAVLDSREIVLFITGDEKLSVLQAAGRKDLYDAPVQALFASGERLAIFWAP